MSIEADPRAEPVYVTFLWAAIRPPEALAQGWIPGEEDVTCHGG